ncbi:MAG: hypothetical protein K8T20_12950 [Planctomycetes bacterium]|nr:hypothetical protein [Planctomycetota bacterium]
MADDAIRDVLKSSKAEQLAVTVHVQGSALTGIVSRIDEATAELRSAKGRTRIVVRLDRIDAVTLE